MECNNEIIHNINFALYKISSAEADVREYEILFAIELHGFKLQLYDQIHLDRFIQDIYVHLLNIKTTIMKLRPIWENEFGNELDRISNRISNLIKNILSYAVCVNINK